MVASVMKLDEETLIILILGRHPELERDQIEITERNLDSDGEVNIYFKIK